MLPGLYLGSALTVSALMLGFTFTGGSRAQIERPKLYCALALPPSQVVSTPQLEVVYCHSVKDGQCHTTLGWLVVSEPVRCE